MMHKKIFLSRIEEFSLFMTATAALLKLLIFYTDQSQPEKAFSIQQMLDREIPYEAHEFESVDEYLRENRELLLSDPAARSAIRDFFAIKTELDALRRKVQNDERIDANIFDC